MATLGRLGDNRPVDQSDDESLDDAEIGVVGNESIWGGGLTQQRSACLSLCTIRKSLFVFVITFLVFASAFRQYQCREDKRLDQKDVLKLGKSLKPVSDKFTSHSYQIMYGQFITQLRDRGNIKMLEIGLGCDMNYSPGASAKLWRLLLPNAELWMAEYNATCVMKMKGKKQLPAGVNVLVGDQGNPAVLESWIKESGGLFDVVIDDGGHRNSQIKTSFDYLWPEVRRGGMYFMEDLQVGRTRPYEDTNFTAVMSDIIQEWMDQLLIRRPKERSRFPLPLEVESIFCQREACVIMKKRV